MVSPGKAIKLGVRIIRKSKNRNKNKISSQLRKMLAQAANGSKSHDRDAVLGCLDELFRSDDHLSS